MNYNKLRKLRTVVAVTIFVLTSALFLELSGYYTTAFSDYILFPQFVPSFLSYIHSPTFLATGFIIILILTVFFGRVYCSFLCPLGILMDIILYIQKRVHKIKYRKKLKYKFIKPYNWLRYSVLSAVAILLFAGSSLLIVLLDPYSIFGRTITNFVRPAVIGVNNLIAIILEFFDNYSVSPHIYTTPDIAILFVPVLFLILIFWLTYKYGRLYCNTICPVGSLLGATANFQVFKIKVDEINCAACGVCETHCKAGCIDSKNKAIDLTRCIACYDCFESCPTEAIILSSKSIIKTEKYAVIPKNKGRRNFLISTGILSTTLLNKVFGQDTIKVYKASTVPEGKTTPICPPGSISIDHFISNCTACTLCVSACPTNVLQPTLFEYGIEGMLMPQMNNRSGFCNFECTICADICPNDAIMPISLEEKKTKQVGKVKFIKDNCVVYSQKTACGACAEHCPTKAVRMETDTEVNLKAPITEDKYCVGCGACEYACPTKPYKAIFVEGNPVHLTAEIRKEEKLEMKAEEDFPF